MNCLRNYFAGVLILACQASLCMAEVPRVALMPSGDAKSSSPIRIATPASVPTLAIINKHENPALADLLFEKLSRQPGLRLLERDSIDLLLNELESSAMSSSSGVYLGGLLHAQGLLFVAPDKNTLHVVLVETGRGLRMFDLVCDPTPEGFERVVRETERTLSTVMPKLRQAQDSRRYVAVMPPEAHGSMPTWMSLDSLGRLLSMHLTAADTLFVVERENLAAVVAESKAAATDESILATADYVLRTTCHRVGDEEVEIRIQVKGVKGGDTQVQTFGIGIADFAERLREASEWVAKSVFATQPVPVDVSAEAARHYKNALAFSARGQSDMARRSLEIAYLLAPEEPAYAQSRIEWLRNKMEARTTPTLDRVDALIEALRIHRCLHPDGAEFSLPSFLLSVPGNATPRERHALRDARQRLKKYYSDYCGLEEGLPDVAKRHLWAAVCPLFFDTPDEALAEIKRVAGLGDFAWGSIRGHRFTAITYWDAAAARKLWLAYLEELSQCPDTSVAFNAHTSKCYFLGAFAYEPGVTQDQTEAVRSFFEWALADPSRHGIMVWRQGEQSRVWAGFGRLPLAAQRRYFETLMMPILKPWTHDNYARVLSYLNALRAAHPEDPEIAEEVVRLLDWTLTACKEFPRASVYQSAIKQIPAKWPMLVPLVPVHHVAEAPKPNPQFLVDGFIQVFDAQKDVPEALRDNAPEFGATGFLIDPPFGWLVWTSCHIKKEGERNVGYERWHVMIAKLDPITGTADVYGIPVPTAMSNVGESVLITRWQDNLCVADLCNVIVVPIDPATGKLDTKRSIRLEGFPPLSHVSHRASALIPVSDSLYVGVRTTTWGANRIGSYGALFRWQQGMERVEEIAAADGLQAGPLSDTHPYQIVAGEAEGADGDVLLLVHSKTGGPSVGWWRYTPGAAGNKWEWIGERKQAPGKTQPWRINRDLQKETYDLIHVADDKITTVARYHAHYAIMNVAYGENAVFWIVGSNVYALPKDMWPGSEDPPSKSERKQHDVPIRESRGQSL